MLLRPNILQPEPIDIALWHEDQEFAHYPEGARAKLAVFPPKPPPYAFLHSNRRYLFKRSRSAFPDQYWAELIAYHVGTLLGVEIPPTFAGFHSQTGEPGAIVEWFYQDGIASFIAGGQFMLRMIPNYDRKKGTQHNYRDVRILGRVLSLPEWDLWWAKTFLFDALIGNTDRHQDNWGLLLYRSEAPAKWLPAPCYDHGTSLGHELFTDRVAEWDPKRFSQYILRGRHHMKWSRGDKERQQHLQMLESMVTLRPELRPALAKMVREFKIERVEQVMQHVAGFRVPVPLTPERAELMLTLIRMRLSIITDLVT